MVIIDVNKAPHKEVTIFFLLSFFLVDMSAFAQSKRKMYSDGTAPRTDLIRQGTSPPTRFSSTPDPLMDVA
jgi:hypothetical protein